MAPQNRPLKLSIVGGQGNILSVKMQKLLCSVKKEGNITTERNAERIPGRIFAACRRRTDALLQCDLVWCAELDNPEFVEVKCNEKSCYSNDRSLCIRDLAI